ncbi:MAG: NADP-dependent oxidoreductase, partial [Catenulispora sp.]|nr:NADP-dependent oxidoreductase [Catenulispora sp.]
MFLGIDGDVWISALIVAAGLVGAAGLVAAGRLGAGAAGTGRAVLLSGLDGAGMIVVLVGSMLQG